MLSKSLQRKKIIIAGLDSKLVIAIEAMLLRKGFSNLSFANECADIYRIIRPFAENSVDLGLVIVDEFLPGGDVGHMCTSLSRENNGIALPFIILKAESSDQLNDSIQSSGDLIYDLYASFREAELLILVELLLVLKNERYLRNQQQEKLISELATRKLLDAKLKYLIAHDELTGLMNRANLEQHIRLSLMRFKALHQNGALLLIDLDRFGLINDLEGFD
ncbi:MAG: GGDEF domain-containing protein, partial [Methylicorpusculum sp.]|nr:GGDEF domain-containing protein [Methylicorpusculum sp.]